MPPIPLGIDVSFDFRSDTPPGKDPDRYSKTLRRYHAALWSKALPGGALFTLSDRRPGCYLHHESELGEFFLSSDAVIPTFKWAKQVQEFASAEEFEAFNAAGYTIGGMMLFPGNRVDGKWTINQARGCECSPLGKSDHLEVEFSMKESSVEEVQVY